MAPHPGGMPPGAGSLPGAKGMAKDLAKDLKSAPSMGEEEEPVDEHEMISEDIIGAIKSGDAAMLTEALKAFVEACGKDPEAY